MSGYAVVIHPDGETERLQYQNDLHFVQSLVDGYFQTVRCPMLPEKMIMLVNEEGLLRQMPINPYASNLYCGPIAGTAVIVRVKGDDLAGLTESQTEGVEMIVKIIYDYLEGE